MSDQQIAVLSVYKNTRGGFNDYTFNLQLPYEKAPLAGHTSIPTVNEEQIKKAIGKAAQEIVSRQGLKSLEDMGSDLYSQLPVKIRSALRTLETPLLLNTEDPTIPWELSYDGEDFLFVRLIVGRMPDVLHKDVPETIVLAEEVPVCLVVAPSKELQGARAEAIALNDLLKKQGADVFCLLEYDATYVRVTRELRNRRYHLVHICGHARFSHDNDPAIELADGGLLTAQAI